MRILCREGKSAPEGVMARAEVDHTRYALLTHPNLFPQLNSKSLRKSYTPSLPWKTHPSHHVPPHEASQLYPHFPRSRNTQTPYSNYDHSKGRWLCVLIGVDQGCEDLLGLQRRRFRIKRVVRASGWGHLDLVGFSLLDLKSVVELEELEMFFAVILFATVVGVGVVIATLIFLSGPPVIARSSSICPHSTPSQPRLQVRSRVCRHSSCATQAQPPPLLLPLLLSKANISAIPARPAMLYHPLCVCHLQSLEASSKTSSATVKWLKKGL